MKYEFEVKKEDAGYLSITVRGDLTIHTEHQSDGDIVDACAAHQCFKALVDVTGFSGELTATEIYQIGSTMKDRGMNTVKRLALLDKPEYEDLNSFYETVLENRGIPARTFSDRQAAIDWLLGH